MDGATRTQRGREDWLGHIGEVPQHSNQQPARNNAKRLTRCDPYVGQLDVKPPGCVREVERTIRRHRAPPFASASTMGALRASTSGFGSTSAERTDFTPSSSTRARHALIWTDATRLTLRTGNGAGLMIQNHLESRHITPVNDAVAGVKPERKPLYLACFFDLPGLAPGGSWMNPHLDRCVAELGQSLGKAI